MKLDGGVVTEKSALKLDGGWGENLEKPLNSLDNRSIHLSMQGLAVFGLAILENPISVES